MKTIFSRWLVFAYIFTIAAASFFAAVVYAAPHPAGTNVKGPDGTIYTIMSEGTKRPYTSGAGFVSYGFNNWNSVVPTNSEDLSLPTGGFIPPQDGKIVCSDRSPDKGTCYLITNGMKAGFTSQQVFEQLGFNFQHAVFGDVSFLAPTSNIDSNFEAHRPGVLVNKDGTIYLVSQNGLLGFPNMEIFYSWGYQLKEVVPANAKDRNMQQIGVVYQRGAGQLIPTSGNNNISVWPPISSNFTALLSAYSPKNTVVAGSNNQVLFEFQLMAPSDKSVEVRQISLDYGGNLPPSYLSNIKLYHYESNAQIGSNSGNVLTHNSAGYAIIPPLILKPGSSAYVQVKADVNSQAVGYSYVGKLTEVWTASSANETSLANITGLPVIGNQVSFIKDTVATIFLDTSRPSSSSVSQGQKGVTLFNFGITNSSDKVIGYKSVGIKLKGTLPLTAFTTLYLYDSSGNLLGSEPLKPEKNYNDILYYDINFPPTAIIGNSTAFFTVKGDVGSAAVGSYSFQVDLLGSVEGYAAVSTTKGLSEWTSGVVTILSSGSNNTSISILAPIGGIVTNGSQYKVKWYDSNFCQQGSGTNVSCPTSLLYSLYILTDATKSLFKPGVDPASYAYYIGTVNANSASGEYNWYAAGDVYLQGARSSLGTNTSYYLLVTKTGTTEYGINSTPFQLSSTLSGIASDRDQKRLADVRQLASALELYFNDYSQYPYFLNTLTPTYIGIIPTAPSEADGNCTPSQNVYTYSSPTANTYTLTFCLGGATGGYSSGPKVLSPAGIQ